MEVLTRLVAQARAVEVGLHLTLVEVLIRLVAQARAVEVRLHSNYVGFDSRFLEKQDMDT